MDPLIGPELLHTLARMGHGDRLAMVDRNYPAYRDSRLVHRLDGVDILDAARAIFSLLPVDSFEPDPIERMQVVGDPDRVTQVQDDFCGIVSGLAGRDVTMSSCSREDFYDHASTVSAVVITGEWRPYSCFIISKGILPELDELDQ